MKRLVAISLLAAIICTLSFGAWGVTRAIKGEQFRMNCEVYIKRAANASSIEIAKTELQKAILYAEKNGLTEGIVSIFIKDPANDIGFWYKNMKNAYVELDNLPEEATALEKSNVLMKVKESLTGNTEDGQFVRCPSGISIYPYNVAYFWWCTISVVLAIISWIWYEVEKQDSSY